MSCQTYRREKWKNFLEPVFLGVSGFGGLKRCRLSDFLASPNTGTNLRTLNYTLDTGGELPTASPEYRERNLP